MESGSRHKLDELIRLFMSYFTDLFSPETYEAFTNSAQDISGFRFRQQNMARRVDVGDKLICYMTKLSRWVGVLEVISKDFVDATPIFLNSDDPFTVRFKVKPLAWLPKEKAIPIHEDKVWKTLSFTKSYNKNSSKWTGKLRNSLNKLEDGDGKFLEDLILAQLKSDKIYEVDEIEYGKITKHKVRRLDKEVTVSIPGETIIEKSASTQKEVRESIKIQAMLAQVGQAMGLNIWVPRNDKAAVLEEMNNSSNLLDILPLNYDDTTLKTIENIDVLWLRGRAIVRAFEVEHTTSIYSGILRMADLLALQPNMNIKLHLVAPDSRRDKVFQEIQRPVFSLLEVAPLSERCTYLSYDSIEEIAGLKHLSHLSDSVLDEYAEEAE
jgi:predicted RNA-binding protein